MKLSKKKYTYHMLIVSLKKITGLTKAQKSRLKNLDLSNQDWTYVESLIIIY